MAADANRHGGEDPAAIQRHDLRRCRGDAARRLPHAVVVFRREMNEDKDIDEVRTSLTDMRRAAGARNETATACGKSEHLSPARCRRPTIADSSHPVVPYT